MRFRNAVIVLGAGASKGARVTGRRTPPLDAEFLTSAADHFRGKHARGRDREKVKAWNEFKSHLNGAGLRFDEIKIWRLEQLSTFLEARASLKGLQLSRGRPRDFAEALEALKVLICYVLQFAGGTRSCELHKKLFDVVKPSAVISFNYDLIADQSMLEAGLLDWKAVAYRGATHISVPNNGRVIYRRIQTGVASGNVPLLKLHGSINWEKQRRGDGFRLAGCELPENNDRIFRYSRVPARPYIVPPVAAKMEITQAKLRRHWRSAIKLLHEAPAWIIWGYSFPVTDTISHVLFRTALSRNRKKKPVLVINPDTFAATRVTDICRKVKVEHYPSIERFLLDNNSLPSK
jgi:hypothetical protein